MIIIGVIPARYKSSRFEGKPLADICGKPMVWWVYQQALKVKEINKAYVATENKKIFDYCIKSNINVLMTSDQHETPNDRVYEVSTIVDGDIFLCINGDEPLIEAAAISRALPEEGDFDDLEYYYSNIVTPIKQPVELVDPSNIKAVIDWQGNAIFVSRSPIPFPKGNMEFNYKKLIGVAAMSKKALQFYVDTPRSILELTEELDLYRFLENGKKVKLKEIDCETVSVDSKKDLEKVKILMKKKIISGLI